MRRPFWLLMVLLATLARGEDGASTKREQVEKEIAELDRTPVAVEHREIAKAIYAIQQEQQKRSSALYEKLQKLRQSEAYREYMKKRQELASERSNAWEVERKAMAEAAKTLYAARHAEIKQAAKVDCPRARGLGLDVLTYPRVDGSTSTGPLSVVIACRVLDVPYEWVYPEPTGHPSWSNQPDALSAFYFPVPGYTPRDYEFSLATLKVVAKPEHRNQERKAIMINSLLAASTSTHHSYVNLIEGKRDLSLAARPPSESERKLAKEKGVVIKLEPVARDAFVFVVNRKNPVKGLTRQQAREIYEEKIADWKVVGGGEGKIQAFRRERDSGSRELFDELVMQGQALSEDERFRPLYAASMAGPFNQVTQQPDGLGYSIYYYEHFMAASPYTRTLAIDGIEPTAESIASGDYPWVTHIYAAYRDGEPQDSPAMRLLKWLSSAEGQAVVRESGYVPEK